MIDIEVLNRRLVEQDAALRAAFTSMLDDASLDADARIARMLAEGLAAIHEHQGNQMVLMLQSGG